LLNRSLRGNVAGLRTSRNPDITEGLESRLSVRIHRILAELPHLTELELGKLYRARMNSGRASATSREVLRPLEPCLFLYSTIMNLGALLGAKPHTLHNFCQGAWGIYKRIKVVLRPKIGHVRPTCQAGWPCNLTGRPSFLLALPLGIGYLEHHHCWTRRQNIFCKCTNTWLADQDDVAGRPHLGSVEPVVCAMPFPHVILSLTMPYFGHNEDMHEFWSIL
jgi:hypothetical protein